MGRERTCGKQTYRSRKVARAVAKRIRGQSGTKDDRKLTAYRCHRCGVFHLTSASASDKANIRDLQRRREQRRPIGYPMGAEMLGAEIGLDLAAVPEGGESWSVHFDHRSALEFASRMAEVSGGRRISETRVELSKGRTHTAISAEAGFWMVVGSRPDQVVGVRSRVKDELDTRARIQALRRGE